MKSTKEFKIHHDIHKKIDYHPKQSMINMPNEILEDLPNYIKSSSHVAFAYSYYYLYTYLWRYGKFLNDNNEILDIPDIKYILGYHPRNQKVDYIIRQDGIMDFLGYTEHVRDIPIIAKSTFEEQFELTYTMYSEMKGKNYIPKKTISHKKPIKAFHRTKKSQTEGKLDGTYYEYINFHCIHPSIFVKCMQHYEELGCRAFHMYAMIKRNNFGSAWFVSKQKFMEILDMSQITYYKYRNALEQYRMIDITKYDFNNNEERMANEYTCIERVNVKL